MRYVIYRDNITGKQYVDTFDGLKYGWTKSRKTASLSLMLNKFSGLKPVPKVKCSSTSRTVQAYAAVDHSKPFRGDSGGSLYDETALRAMEVIAAKSAGLQDIRALARLAHDVAEAMSEERERRLS